MNDIDRQLRAADPLASGGLRPMSLDAGKAIAQEIVMTSITEPRAASTASITAPADVRGARARRRRRLLAVSLISAGVLGIPTAAVAVRALPGSVGDVFAYWSDDPKIDIQPESATRAATGPGPDGSTFTVLKASNDAGNVCLAALFESPDSAARSSPTGFEGSGSGCFPADRDPGAFGLDGAVMGGSELTTFSRSAGAAVRAELQMPDGTKRPALLVDGFFFGWYPSTGAGEPTLNGFDADGAAAGAVQLPRLR